LLLKHYREFVKHVNNYIPDDAGSDEIESRELAIESIKKSKRRTYIIVQFIQRAMEMYRISCEQSGKPEQIRKYKIVYALYVEEPQRKIEEIADCHNVENRTLY